MLDTLAHATPTADPADAAYPDSIAAFRATREADLVAEDGWLSVVGLDWLEPGANRVGADADNDVVLPAGPAHVGVVTVHEGGETTIVLAPSVDAVIEGTQAREARLVDTEEDYHHPTVVRCGAMSFLVADRGGRKGLRVKDNAAAARHGFAGLDYFPVDPSWCVVAEWVPLEAPHAMLVATGWGNIETRVATRKAVFDRDGKRHTLYPLPNQNTDLMFVLADRTSGRETYGACRFLVGVLQGEDRIVLDFNRAINPPCAFSPFATCPIAPPENRLALRIAAGEKTYRAGA